MISKILAFFCGILIILFSAIAIIMDNPNYTSLKEIKCVKSGNTWDEDKKKCTEKPFIDDIDRIETKEIGEAKKNYDISIFYPQFGISKLDTQIEADIQGLFTGFKNMRGTSGVPGQLIVSSNYFRLKNDKANILSILIKKDKIIGEKEEKSETFATYVYDINNAKFLVLSDIFTTQGMPLSLIYTKVFPLLKEKLPGANEDMMKRGTGKSDFENYKYFIIDGQKLIFIFPEGQVAEKKYASVDIMIPFFEINNILNTNLQ